MKRPIPPGHVRLFRGETSAFGGIGGQPTLVPDWVKENPDYQATVGATGRWFSATIEEARYYCQRFGSGNLITFVDIPAADIELYRASNQPAGDFSAGGRGGPMARREFFVTAEIAGRRELVQDTQLEWALDDSPTVDALSAFWHLKNRHPQVSIDEPFRKDLLFLADVMNVGPIDGDSTPPERQRQLRRLGRLWVDRSIAAEPVVRGLTQSIDEWDTHRRFFPEIVLQRFAEMRLSGSDVRRVVQLPASEMRGLFRRAPDPAAVDEIAALNANAEALVKACKGGRTRGVEVER